jgi:hypothetical protein
MPEARQKLGAASLALSVTVCALLLDLMAPLSLDGLRRPSKISRRGSPR